MDTFLNYLLFFAVGFFQDLLITYYYQLVAKDRALPSAAASAAVTLVNLLVLYTILQNIGTQTYSIILVYAFGNGVGTFVVVKRQKLLHL
ncbi:MAG: hypothetical protein ACYC48_00795 [Minisyncoccota bacterium]